MVLFLFFLFLFSFHFYVVFSLGCLVQVMRMKPLLTCPYHCNIDLSLHGCLWAWLISVDSSFPLPSSSLRFLILLFWSCFDNRRLGLNRFDWLCVCTSTDIHFLIVSCVYLLLRAFLLPAFYSSFFPLFFLFVFFLFLFCPIHLNRFIVFRFVSFLPRSRHTHPHASLQSFFLAGRGSFRFSRDMGV